MFRALGDPTRLRVVHELAGGTRCVCELRERLDVNGPLLSHHLAVLRHAGIVSSARRGRWVDYTLETDTVTETFATVARQTTGGAR